jgi:hypothetical protein
VGTIVAMTLPALVIGLILLGIVDLASTRRSGARRGTPLSSTGFEVLEAVFHPAKHHQVDERQSRSLMRDEVDEAAPPFSTIDLDGGRARLVVSGPAVALATQADPNRC